MVNLQEFVSPDTLLRIYKILDKLLDIMLAPIILGYLILRIETYQNISSNGSDEIEKIEKKLYDLDQEQKRVNEEQMRFSLILVKDSSIVHDLIVKYDKKYAVQLKPNSTKEYAEFLIIWYSEEQKELDQLGIWNRYIK